MATTINWVTKVINVLRNDMPLEQTVPSEIRRLDLDLFRLELKDLEDGEEGIVYLDTHAHNTAVTVGGVTLARVIEIINGYTVTFEDGQYAVNLVGANSNVADVTNVNQVSVRSQNSAGLVDLPAIKQQSYINAMVWIDTIDGSSGISYPKGTPPDPVDNYDDAYLISVDTSLPRFHLRGVIIFGIGDTVENTDWLGPSPIISNLVFSGQSTVGATFTKLGITGTMNGRSSFEICSLVNVSGLSGILKECGLQGTITLDSANVDNVLFFQCTSVVAGTGKPTVDINGSSGDIHFRKWTGGVKISNFTAGNDMSIDCDTGTIELDSTCTAGTVKVRMHSANASLTDNSGAGCTVIIETVTATVDESTIVDALTTYGVDTLTNVKPSKAI